MGNRMVHCSFHKCLTKFSARVMKVLADVTLRRSGGYRHFNSFVEDFYGQHGNHRVASVNNHALDLGRLADDVRITRFVRDPRDLVVSGYFYHRRGAERWCNVIDPTDDDWRVVNGSVPAGMGSGQSFASYLQEVPLEEGLIAEIDFRQRHLESMRDWPVRQDRIRVFRYEDIIGNERRVFSELFDFHEVPVPERLVGQTLAGVLSSRTVRRSNKHVRNRRPGQWQELFSPAVLAHFNDRYTDVLERHDYA